MFPHRFNKPRLAALLLVAFSADATFALPEDAAQAIDMDFITIELLPDQGLVVLQGTADKPARITQGSLVISGIEVRLERLEDGSLKKVTATGAPARFQQQPAADKQVVHASGLTLVFDNAAQLMTIDDDAELSQAGYVMTHQHIEYNLATGNASADAGSTEQQGRMSIPPAATAN